MIDARQKFTFAFCGAKLSAALFFVLCTSVFCQAQTVASETCDFSKYKPFAYDHFLLAAVVEQPKLVYPPAARAVRAEGKVRVKILVDLRGTVKGACVVEGHPLLQAAAVQAAFATKFKPNFGLGLPQKRYGRRFITDEIVYNFRSE